MINKILAVMMLAAVLSGCTLGSGNDQNDKLSPTPAISEANGESEAPGTTAASDATIIPASKSFDAGNAIYIGKSDHGDVYEAFGHLYIIGADQQAVEIGDSAIVKRGAKLSDDGSVLVYQFLNSSIMGSPLSLALYAIETGSTIVLDTYSLPAIDAYIWAGDQVLVVEAAHTPSPEFVMYSGSTGEKTRTGEVFQTLIEPNEKRSYLLRFDPPAELQSIGATGSPISISLLSSDGKLHPLLEESFFETQFLDIRMSDDHSAIAIWTHLVPDYSSQLLVASVDASNWTVGEWQTYKTAPKKEGFIRFHTDRQIVLLSNEQSFRLPSPLADS